MSDDEGVKTAAEVPDQPPELRQALDEIESDPPAQHQPRDDRDVRAEGDSAAQRVTRGGKETIETTHPGGAEQTGAGDSLQQDQGNAGS